VVSRFMLPAYGPVRPTYCREGGAVRPIQRYLILGLAMTAVPIAIVDTAPPAGADCNNVGGTTVCSQGEVRGPDGVPRASTPVVPYPCEFDWYCDSDTDLDIDFSPSPPPSRPDIGRPGRPDIGRPG